jgi:hypothetical protein
MIQTPTGGSVNQSIAVVEPQMDDVFHAAFNAALLHAVALAYPETPISFRAFPNHTRAVRDILDQHAPELPQRIEWRTLPIASSNSLIARWRQSSRAIREILASRERVLFCSISRMQLLQLKRQLRSHGQHPQMRAVLHGDLEQIDAPPQDRFPMSLFPLHRVLLSQHPPALRYILLSQSIRAKIPQPFRQVFATAGVIDHPYHFRPVHPSPPKPLTFGIFGNTGEGFQLETVARAVRQANPSLRFRLVGFLVDKESVDRLQPFVEDVGYKPISREIFIDRAEDITHALWLAPLDHSGMRASGTFFDALSFAKPLVYTANPYIDAYFEMEPGIGIRCETLEDVSNAILNLAATSTPETYAEGRAAMERLRRRFTPEELAKTLPASLDWD